MRINEVYLKPREKALKEGINSLSNTELLAIILNEGYPPLDVLELSELIINKVGKITNFLDLTYQELIKIRGIKNKKALSILACVEFGKRIFSYHEEKIIFDNPNNIYEYIKKDTYFLKQENFIAIYVDIKGQLIEKRLISIGNTNSVVCDFKEIFKWYYIYKASGFYIVHNHPSLNPTPSLNDNLVTLKLIERCTKLDITFIDHLIIGDGFFSYFKNSNVYRIKDLKDFTFEENFLTLNIYHKD